MRKVLKITAIVLAVVLVLGAAGFFAWTRISRYPAFDGAAALAASAQTSQGWYAFEPTGTPVAGLIFYPGGLVDPAAYAPLMKRLSDGGVLAVVVPMPLDLAVLGIERADPVFAAYPGIQRWAIGGHSLGGVMACQYAASHPAAVKGLVLLASYPAESTDLSGLDALGVLLYGTEDPVSADVFREALTRLPADTELIEIAGANHAQFGDYGPQAGDGIAAIGREEQQSRTADAILALMRGLR